MNMLLLTVLIFWSIQLLKNKKEELPPIPYDEIEEASENEATPAPSAEESQKIIASLSEEARSESALEVSPQFWTLGSRDPASPYRMLVTLSNRGAAVTRIELNEKEYRDCGDVSGYLGQIIVDETLAQKEIASGLPGVGIQAVGPGTPAYDAGLREGDRIVALQMIKAGPRDQEGERVLTDSFEALRGELLKTSPGQTIEVSILRKAALADLPAVAVETSAAETSAAEDAEVNVSKETVQTAPSESASEETAQAAPTESVSEETTAPSEGETALQASKTPALADRLPQLEDRLEKVQIQLTRAPLSVIRPAGIIANYNDYQNFAGLQGASYDYSNDKFDVTNLKEEVRRPNTDPSSFLLTLADYDQAEKLDWPKMTPAKLAGTVGRNTAIDKELPFYDIQGEELVKSEKGLRDGYWELVEAESNDQTAVFRKVIPSRRLEVRKTYRLAAAEGADAKKKAGKAPEYHLDLTVSVKNLDAESGHSVSYYLDGPTGLPVEGLWYSMGRKTGPKWGTYGLRDVVLKMGDKNFHVLRCSEIADETMRPSEITKINYIGVDSQYFQSTVIPQASGETPWMGEYLPIRVGARIKEQPTFTDVSFRLKSAEAKLAPAGQDGDVLEENYKIFTGPKQQSLLNDYGLGETLVYGWFWFVSKPLVALLHFFRHYLVFNYGLAIILLTIIVRLCVFPLSMKQIASSMKMQKIQPELNALKERYKDNPQEMMKAQRELWQRYKINPLGGCLPLFIQMPVFIGLYKALSLDVHLYGTPLISEKIRWCSNLAAPDMMIDWHNMWNSIGWPGFNLGHGMFTLGPYLNLLPILTIALFLIQQKVMMPPPTGTPEEQAQQRTMRIMMKFMMIFMGIMFFKVPSGLCIYFIASSLWGLLERRFHPKFDLAPAAASGNVIDIPSRAVSEGSASNKATSSGNANKASRSASRKNRGRRFAAEETQPEKKSWRARWEELLEKAKEQQKLAKAEAERRVNANKRRK